MTPGDHHGIAERDHGILPIDVRSRIVAPACAARVVHLPRRRSEPTEHRCGPDEKPHPRPPRATGRRPPPSRAAPALPRAPHRVRTAGGRGAGRPRGAASHRGPFGSGRLPSGISQSGAPPRTPPLRAIGTTEARAAAAHRGTAFPPASGGPRQRRQPRVQRGTSETGSTMGSRWSRAVPRGSRPGRRHKEARPPTELRTRGARGRGPGRQGVGAPPGGAWRRAGGGARLPGRNPERRREPPRSAREKRSAGTATARCRRRHGCFSLWSAGVDLLDCCTHSLASGGADPSRPGGPDPPRGRKPPPAPTHLRTRFAVEEMECPGPNTSGGFRSSSRVIGAAAWRRTIRPSAGHNTIAAPEFFGRLAGLLPDDA